MRASRERSRHAAKRRAALLAALLASSAPAATTHVGAHDENGLHVGVSAAFYADTSCLLTVERTARVGRTQIDADVGGGDSRMLVHCDTDDGRRLTLLARGDRLGSRARVALLSRDDMESGDDGIIAWLTSAGTTFADENAPRRYVASGHVSIREAPPVQVAGSALYTDRRAFALLDGELETLLAHPGGGEDRERGTRRER